MTEDQPDANETNGIKTLRVMALASLFGRNVDEEDKLLAPGATEQEIKAFQSAIQLELPASFYDFYRWHNGSVRKEFYSIPFDNGEYILSLDEIVGTKKAFDDNLEAGAFDRYEPGTWWDLGWVPFLYIADWHLRVIDTVGSYNGKVGQIIAFDFKSLSGRQISHASFAAWLDNIIALKNANLLWHGEMSGEMTFAQEEEVRRIIQELDADYPISIATWQFIKKTGPRNIHFGEMVEAIKSGELDAVKLLLEDNVVGLSEVDEYSDSRNTPFHYALDHRHADIAYFLIEQGADLSIKNLYGQTPPTQLVVQHGGKWFAGKREQPYQKARLKLVTAMRDAGGFIEYDLLLANAVSGNHLEMVRFCVEDGQDPNADMKYMGQNYLYHAIEKYCQVDIIAYLVKQGADPNKVTKDGKTAVSLLHELNEDNLMYALRKEWKEQVLAIFAKHDAHRVD